MRAPLLINLPFSHWQLSWSLLAEVAAVAALYLFGAARARRWPVRRTASFLGGVGCIMVALQSGIDAYDDQLLSVHMVQHMLLLMVAPLLLHAGRPVMLALRALPVEQRRWLAHLLARGRPLTRPWTCLAVFALIVLGTHLPAFYDATLRHPLLHDLEHALYVLAGLALWFPVLDADPLPAHRLGGLSKLGYMLASMLPMAIIGAYLNRHASAVYTPYVATSHALGVSAVTDQATAGAIMWVAGNTIMIAVGLWAIIDTMVAEERRLAARERTAQRQSAGARTLDREPLV